MSDVAPSAPVHLAVDVRSERDRRRHLAAGVRVWRTEFADVGAAVELSRLPRGGIRLRLHLDAGTLRPFLLGAPAGRRALAAYREIFLRFVDFDPRGVRVPVGLVPPPPGSDFDDLLDELGLSTVWKES